MWWFLKFLHICNIIWCNCLQSIFSCLQRWFCCLELGFARIPAPAPVVEPAERTVYAVMVTGRDESRLALASVSIESFFRQTFSRRHLLIINDGRQSIDRFLMAALGRVGTAFELRDLCEDASVKVDARKGYVLSWNELFLYYRA